MLSASSLSRAHHDAPTGLGLAWREGAADSSPIVLTNRGLVFSNEGGPAGSSALRCNEAYGVSAGAVPSAWLDATGALLLQTTLGVSITADQGCTFVRATGLPDLPLGAFARDPSAPSRLLLATQDYAGGARVFASEDFGHSWSARAPNGPASVYESLVIGADGARVYASGTRYDGASQRLVPTWAVSRDGGASFVERDLEGLPRVALGAHPRDVDTIFAREATSTGISQPHDYLVRSQDGGATFTRVHAPVGVITTFSASPDGSRIYVGTEVDGLHVSRDGGSSFTRVAPDDVLSVHCLHHRGGALYVCATRSPYTQGVWSTTDDGATFSEQIAFARVAAQVACSEPTNLCDAAWASWQRELAGAPKTGRDTHAGAGPAIITDDTPGGAPAAGAPPGPSAAATAHESEGGCNVATINVPTRELCWLLALSLLVARRKKPS